MRFLADMGIGLDVVASLRADGHDALHLREEGLQRLSDAGILAKARREERILLTHDLDMGRLVALSVSDRPSLITFRLGDMRPASVLAHLAHALNAFGDELRRGAVLAVTDHAVRCHALPITPTRGPA